MQSIIVVNESFCDLLCTSFAPQVLRSSLFHRRRSSFMGHLLEAEASCSNSESSPESEQQLQDDELEALMCDKIFVFHLLLFAEGYRTKSFSRFRSETHLQNKTHQQEFKQTKFWDHDDVDNFYVVSDASNKFHMNTKSEQKVLPRLQMSVLQSHSQSHLPFNNRKFLKAFFRAYHFALKPPKVQEKLQKHI